MAILGTCIVGYCLVFGMNLEHLPYFLVAAAFVILSEFHPRVDGVVQFGKFRAPVAHRDGKTEEMPAQPPSEAHLRDVSDPERRQPTFRRRRSPAGRG